MFADIDVGSAEKAASESQSLAKHSSYRAVALAVDVSREDDMAAMIAKTVQEFGRIDYAVNSAGVSFQFMHNRAGKDELTHQVLDWREVPKRDCRDEYSRVRCFLQRQRKRNFTLCKVCESCDEIAVTTISARTCRAS